MCGRAIPRFGHQGAGFQQLTSTHQRVVAGFSLSTDTSAPFGALEDLKRGDVFSKAIVTCWNRRIALRAHHSPFLCAESDMLLVGDFAGDCPVGTIGLTCKGKSRNATEWHVSTQPRLGSTASPYQLRSPTARMARSKRSNSSPAASAMPMVPMVWATHYTVGRNGGAIADILRREIPGLIEDREA